MTYRVFLFLSLLVLAAGPAPSQETGMQTIARSLSAGDLKGALDLIDTKLRGATEDVRLWVLRGKVLDELGRVSDSEAAYRRAMEIHPDSTQALQGLAELQYRTGHRDAQATLAKLVAADPANQTAHAMLGVLNFETKHYQAAADHFSAAGPAIQDDRTAMWQYAQSLLVIRHPAPAGSLFRMLLASEPGNSQLRFNLALSLYEAKDYTEAKQVLGPLVRRPQPIVEALSLMASIELASGHSGDAIAALRRAIELYPGNDQPYVDLAALCMDRDALPMGLRVLDAALEVIPESPRLYAIRGAFHAQLGHEDAAQADFLKADREGVAPRSVAMIESGKFEESISLLRSQVAQHADDANSWYLLGTTLLRQGLEPASKESNEARTALARSLSIDPGLIEARIALGKIHLLEGNTGEAAREFEHAVAADPNNRTAVFRLSQTLRRLGKNEEAAKLSARVGEMLAQDLRKDSDSAAARAVQTAPSRSVPSK
jgi:cytochrome c-type biogenesis protein CcmH/NrfG